MEKIFFSSIDGFHISRMKQTSAYNMTSPHYHNAYEFYLMLDGERNVFYNDASIKLNTGDLFIIKPFVLHCMQSNESSFFERYVFNIMDNELDDILTESEKQELFSDLHTGIVHLNQERFIHIRRRFEDMEQHWQKPMSCKRKLFHMKTAVFIADVVQLLKECASTLSEPLTVKNPELAGAIDYVNHHYTENITLEFMAEYVHMSYSNFCAVFKRETGSTFLNYLNSIRSSQAHKMLLQTNEKIQTVAEKNGFSSVLHMERVFKKLYGKTPKQMKKD